MLSELPTVVIVELTEYLKNDIILCKTMSLVCKRWQSITKDIFCKSENLDKPLIWACENGKYECVKYLLTFTNVDPSTTNNKCIHSVFSNDFLFFYKKLRTSGTLSILENTRFLGVFRKKYNDYINILSLLLKDKRIQLGSEIVSVLKYACMSEHIELVEEFIMNYEMDLKDLESFFHYICSNGNIKLFKLLMTNKNIIPECYNDQPLYNACLAGNLEIVKELLNLPRIFPTRNIKTFVICACNYRRTDILKELLKYNAIDPTVSNNLLLQTACSIQSSDILKDLLRNEKIDPSINLGKGYPIVIAARYGCYENVKLLLKDKRVDPAVEDYSAIKLAFHVSELIVLELLKDERIDPSFENNYAFYTACQFNMTNVINYLLQIPGIDPSDKGNRALRNAIENKYYELVNMLLQHESVINKEIDY